MQETRNRAEEFEKGNQLKKREKKRKEKKRKERGMTTSGESNLWFKSSNPSRRCSGAARAGWQLLTRKTSSSTGGTAISCNNSRGLQLPERYEHRLDGSRYKVPAKKGTSFGAAPKDLNYIGCTRQVRSWRWSSRWPAEWSSSGRRRWWPTKTTTTSPTTGSSCWRGCGERWGVPRSVCRRWAPRRLCPSSGRGPSPSASWPLRPRTWARYFPENRAKWTSFWGWAEALGFAADCAELEVAIEVGKENWKRKRESEV